MLRIAVCDDDKDAVQIHKGIVEDCLRQYGSMAVLEKLPLILPATICFMILLRTAFSLI